jgi:hypothetical protein
MLRRLAASLFCIACSLWFGGLAALFLFATLLFSQDRPTALKAAPMMFLAFERYQLILAAAALLAVVAWRILAKSIRVTVLFWLLAAATLPAALGPVLVTSKMEQLRQQGQADSPQFRKLHGISMIAYTGETFILLVAGLFLPWSMQEETHPDGTTIHE